jgi:formyl-CoA transferase
MRLPLDGVRVLELGNYIAAPMTGRMLADFGAEVIKVERPGTGDELRRWRLYAGATSMLFHTINRNKKSIVCDLKTDAGRRDIIALVKHCDVVVENFRPGTLEKWGIGAAVLDEANPSLIIIRISAFGQTGPMSSRPGFAAVAEGFGGLREMVGDPDRPPARVGVSIGDSIAGLYGAFGAVMALYDRQRRHGASIPLVDRIIDVALNESVYSVMESLIPDYLAYGVERHRTGGSVGPDLGAHTDEIRKRYLTGRQQ